MSRTIILASGNRNKFFELSEFFRPAGVQVLFGPDVLGQDPEIIEDGTTYAQNALKKARFWAGKTGMPALSDDSGLEVRALSWGPGISSARVAKDDPSRILWLLEKMEGIQDRAARFVACLALVFPENRQCWLTEGYCWGRIARQPSGSEGFGYDPLFVPDGYDEPFAVLGQRVKSRISHRAVATFSMRRML